MIVARRVEMERSEKAQDKLWRKNSEDLKKV